MYRRSNSSSNIPLPKTNLFGTKDSKTSKVGRRSQSTSRLSRRDSATSLSQIPKTQRKSSLDRKSSTVGLLKVTPLHRPGGRSGSLQRTTPTSALSQRTNSSRGTTPSSNRKDYVTIQKLSTDKKWVADQYVKVQNFVISSGLFDLSVVDSTNIKPPSINNFIYVTGIMLMEILPKVKISKENYRETIPAQLKVLRYPGTLSNSVLKTVNTMHSWPQVIGMWSWLIDKVNLCKDTTGDLCFGDHLEPEELTKFNLRQNVKDFIMKRYGIFNMVDGDCEEEVEKVHKTYVRNLAELLDADFEKFDHLQEDIVKKKEYRNKHLQDIEILKAENEKMESELEEMQNEIADFQESDPIETRKLENELEQLQSNLTKQREAIEATKKNVCVLEEAVKVQPCTYEEKRTLLQKLEELKGDIQVKREKIEHYREIKSKYDHKLTTEISKIKSLVIQWNRSLMEVSIQKQCLKKLLLREKGFHDPNFLKELKEMLDYKSTVENEVAEALIKINDELSTAEHKNRKVVNEIQVLNETIRRMNDDCLVIVQEIENIGKEIKNVTRDLEAKKTSHAEQIKELQDNDSSDAQTKTIAELKEKKERLAVEVKKFGPKMLSFFIEMHNQIVTNLKEMDGIKAKIAQKIENKQRTVLEQQQRMIDVLKSLKKS